MLCSIVHKNMGGKWEAILAQIFAVGGRFPTYPAMVLVVLVDLIVVVVVETHLGKGLLQILHTRNIESSAFRISNS